MSDETKELFFIRSLGQTKALQSGLDFIEAMREIQAMTGISQEELDDISHALLKMGTDEVSE